MKKVLLLSFMLLFCASLAFGQAGGINLFSDPVYTSCMYSGAPGVAFVYVVHQYTPAATASQWMMQSGGGWTCMWLADTPAFTVIGNTQTGVAVAYGGCLVSDILLVTVMYNCLAVQPTCAYVEVVVDPGATSGTIEVADCGSPIALYPGGGVGSVLFVGPNGSSCSTHPGWPGGRPCGLPTKETNWGKIKAMYN
jgi:hypothetical protein